LEFVNAFAELAKEFGCEILKPIKKDSETYLDGAPGGSERPRPRAPEARPLSL